MFKFKLLSLLREINLYAFLKMTVIGWGLLGMTCQKASYIENKMFTVTFWPKRYKYNIITITNIFYHLTITDLKLILDLKLFFFFFNFPIEDKNLSLGKIIDFFFSLFSISLIFYEQKIFHDSNSYKCFSVKECCV